MCDYSLQNVKTRPAAIGDKLIVSRIINQYGNETASKGFAAADDRETAVCVLPGTEIAFDEKIRESGGGGYAFSACETEHDTNVGRFRQIKMEEKYVHHDAFELPGGAIVTLNSLCAGQRATVLQLPAQPKTEAEVKEQERVAVYG